MDELDLSFTDSEAEEQIQPLPLPPVQYQQHHQQQQHQQQHPQRKYSYAMNLPDNQHAHPTNLPPAPSGSDAFRKYYHFMSDDIDEQPTYRMKLTDDFMTANLNTTAHGIPNVVRADSNYKRGFWGVVIFLATVGLVFNIVWLTTKYLSYPKQVAVTIASNKELNFPAVTICNMNPVKKSAIDGSSATNSNINSSSSSSSSSNNNNNSSIVVRKKRQTSYYSSDCPANWLKYQRFCYGAFASYVTWNVANDSCFKYNAQLTSITDQLEFDFVTSVLMGQILQDSAWFGLLKTDPSVINSSTYFTDGNDSPFRMYMDSSMNEYTACFRLDYTYSVYLDRFCDASYNFICKKRAVPTITSAVLQQPPTTTTTTSTTTTTKTSKATTTTSTTTTSTTTTSTTTTSTTTTSTTTTSTTTTSTTTTSTTTTSTTTTSTTTTTKTSTTSTTTTTTSTNATTKPYSITNTILTTTATKTAALTSVITTPTVTIITTMTTLTTSTTTTNSTTTITPATFPSTVTTTKQTTTFTAPISTATIFTTNDVKSTLTSYATASATTNNVTTVTTYLTTATPTITLLTSNATTTQMPAVTTTATTSIISTTTTAITTATPTTNILSTTLTTNGRTTTFTPATTIQTTTTRELATTTKPIDLMCCCTCCLTNYGYCQASSRNTLDMAQNTALKFLDSYLNPDLASNLEMPTMVNGSAFDRPALTASFQEQELFLEKIASLTPSEQKVFGYSVRDLLSSCTFEGVPCDMDNDFESFYNPIHGNCFIFNAGWNASKPIIVAHGKGPENGLEIVANIDQPNYAKEAGSVAGLRIVVLTQGQISFPEDEGVTVSPGLTTFISVEQHEITRLGVPFSNCVNQLNDPLRSAYSYLYPVEYRSKGCENTCYQQYIMSRCGCIDSKYPNDGDAFSKYKTDNMTFCSVGNFEQDECRYAMRMLFMNESLTCDCSERCQDVIFQSFSSFSTWPLKDDEEKVSRMYNLTSNQVVTDNLLRARVFYSDFYVHQLDENPDYEITQYFSDLCGVVGLWFGFAIMTFFEYVEFLVDVICLTCIKIHQLCRRK